MTDMNAVGETASALEQLLVGFMGLPTDFLRSSHALCFRGDLLVMANWPAETCLSVRLFPLLLSTAVDS
jgi:hypothetical protein